MNTLGFGHFAHSAGVAAALLAGCGAFRASQDDIRPPVGTVAMSRTRGIAVQTERSGSWMLPEAKSDDLLYVSNPGEFSSVAVFSYPDGKLVGELNKRDIRSPAGECADKAGDVFIVNQKSKFGWAQIVEYKHGAKKPVAILRDGFSGGYASVPYGCAIDPVTGNLAVTNTTRNSDYNPGDIAIWQGAKGSPRIYYDPDVAYPYWCTFDDEGNLFVDGSSTNASYSPAYAELPHGVNAFRAITLNQELNPYGIQWKKGRLVIGDFETKTVYQFRIDGSEGTETGTVTLGEVNLYAQFFIQDNVIIAANTNGRNVMFWNWPRGGDPIKIIGDSGPYGVVVSLAK